LRDPSQVLSDYKFNRQPVDQNWPQKIVEVQSTPVTNFHWSEVMGGPTPAQDAANLPKTNVKHAELLAFLKQLDEHDPAYRHYLMSDQTQLYILSDRGRDWERYLAHGNERTLLAHAWLAENSGGRLHPVATRMPVEFDGQLLYDLVGNAQESTRSS